MKVKKLILAASLALASLSANAQYIYGNSFPNWDVRGPLTTQTLAVSTTSTFTGDVAMTGNLTVSGTQTTTGIQTFTAAPVMTALTASRAVFTDSGKALTSNAITGSGNVVMSASPTLTGTIGAASQTLSGTLGVTGVATFTAAPIVSALTASLPVVSDGSKALASATVTGTGTTVVMQGTPTLTTPVIGAATGTSLVLTDSLRVGAPRTGTGATDTIAVTDSFFIANRAGTITLTMPTASSFTGRKVCVKTIQAQTVVSGASNVVPIDTGTAGTAILAGTAGKWACMVSDATNWVIVQAN